MKINEIIKQACLYGGLVFLLATCGGPKKKVNGYQDDILFQEAKLTDIPVILGATRLQDGDVTALAGQVVLQFETRLDVREVVNFYEQEMERLGWQQPAAFSGREYFLMFEKPSSVALIVAGTAKKGGTLIRIFMSQRVR